jgi:hypothetical protein
MKQSNYLYKKDDNLLILTDENYKPYAAFKGRIAKRKYQEIKAKVSITDIRAELELCKSVLLNSPDLPADIRADYQRRYRRLKKAVATAQNELLTKTQ